MPNSYVKQLKIGSNNYNIKAEKAANNASTDFVVRDAKYGTDPPSGGESGQLYLQYDATSSVNNYVYAEDTVTSTANTVDVYYSKSEVDAEFNAINTILTALNLTGTNSGSIKAQTMNVSFSGATGGTVPWYVVKFQKLILCVCNYQVSVGLPVNQGWGSLYLSPQQSSPPYPVAYNNVLYSNITLSSASTADGTMMFRNSDANLTSAGNWRVVRGQTLGSLNNCIVGVLAIGTIA